MTHQLLFVDLENVQRLDLSLVPNTARVLVFYGITQKRLPEDLVVKAQPLGARLKWMKISGQGPNALDFHIAFYLGQELTTNPKSECAILSRDTGFDPLIRHLHAMGHVCRRVGSLKDAFPAPKRTADTDPFARLLSLLKKEPALPTKLKGLTGKVKSWFPRLAEGERHALIQRLLKESRVSASGEKLAYVIK
jgi:hypothetical protein